MSNYCDKHDYDFIYGVSNDGRCPWCIIDAQESEVNRLRDAAWAMVEKEAAKHLPAYEKQQQENQRLREALKEARDDFDSAAEGNGVNFYQCAEDIRKALQEQGDE